MSVVNEDELRDLERDAYMAVTRAFMAAAVMDPEKDVVATNLRQIFKVTNEMHLEVIQAVREELQSIKEGRATVRGLARAKSGKLGQGGAFVGGLSTAPSLQRRGPGRPMGGAMLQRSASGAARTPSTGPRGARPRPRGGRASNAHDPSGHVGRRIWRFWANENPPWVEGYVLDFDPEAGTHTILYDPNTGEAETLEEGFSFAVALQTDYVLGEYLDMASMRGSRRQYERPHVSAAAMAAPPPGQAGGSHLAPAPSKKRKTSAPVPQQAPFDAGYLISRLPLASEEELSGMLAVLERREAELGTELESLDHALANGADLAERAALEAKFQELCDSEAALMEELAALKQAEA